MQARKKRYKNKKTYNILMAGDFMKDISNPDELTHFDFEKLDEFTSRREALEMAQEYRMAIPGRLIVVTEHIERVPA